MEMDFDEWWEELNYLAQEKGLLHFLGDKGDHRVGWSEGNSPSDEMDDQIGAGT